MNRKTIAMLLVLFAVVAFAARLGTDIYFKAWRSPSAMEHKPIAQALVNGKGFTFGDWKYYGPTSAQSPPFPFLLAGMYKAFGALGPDGKFIKPAEENAYIAILVINALAGAGLVFLTYQMTRTLGGTSAAGIIAAALVAIWPSQIYACRFVQAIALITCGLMGMVTLYYKAVRTGKSGSWAGYSFLAAFVTLIEPVFLPGMLLSGGLMFLSRQLSLQAKLRNCLILGFAIVAVIGPWTLRNYIVHDHHIIPIKGSFWVNMWKGNNDYATGTDRVKLTPAQERLAKKKLAAGELDEFDTPHQYDMLDPSDHAKLENHPEVERDKVFHDIVTKWIATHPRQYIQLCGIRLVKSLWIDWDNPRSVIKVYLYSRATVLLLTLGGLITAVRKRWALSYPALMALTALASYTLTITAARFAFPFEPLQLALAGGFLASLLPTSGDVPDPTRSIAGLPAMSPG
jgi:4-amino-4-deoxy-L-arabinose transferase-like glycosyltransferase